jgi:type II secretory pathway pseudopilin PulG
MKCSIPKIYGRDGRGLTLLEVLVSVSFAAILLAALAVPLSIGLINRSQGKKMTEATNLAQAQLEAIRTSWLDPNIVSGSTTTQGQQDFDNNNININAWNTPNTSSPCVPSAGAPFMSAYAAANKDMNYSDATKTPKLLTDPTQVAPNNINIPLALKAIAIDANGDCKQDYWGQILLGNPPDATGSANLRDTKRVVVRIFSLQDNPSTLSYTPVNAASPTRYSQSPNQQRLPLAVLVADIARP